VNASDENLRWALGLEADRMVKHDHAGQGPGDGDAGGAATRWSLGRTRRKTCCTSACWPRLTTSTTYGKTVIGNRTDVERVPIENLAVFYKKYYQPDDAGRGCRGASSTKPRRWR